VFSCLSFFTTKLGKSEIYPFYFWKLYSQPAGWELEHSSYRIYAQNPKTKVFERLENHGRANFNEDETLYFLNPITNRLKENPNPKDLHKLKVFCQYLAPEYIDYKVVEEVYNPLQLLKNPENYDTSTVVEIP
jgi:dsRNA-specific ribonuclease